MCASVLCSRPGVHTPQSSRGFFCNKFLIFIFQTQGRCPSPASPGPQQQEYVVFDPLQVLVPPSPFHFPLLSLILVWFPSPHCLSSMRQPCSKALGNLTEQFRFEILHPHPLTFTSPSLVRRSSVLNFAPFHSGASQGWGWVWDLEWSATIR